MEKKSWECEGEGVWSCFGKCCCVVVVIVVVIVWSRRNDITHIVLFSWSSPLHYCYYYPTLPQLRYLDKYYQPEPTR